MLKKSYPFFITFFLLLYKSFIRLINNESSKWRMRMMASQKNKYETENKDNDKYKEKNLSNSCSCNSNSGKTKQCRNDRNDKEDNSPIKHLQPLSKILLKSS